MAKKRTPRNNHKKQIGRKKPYAPLKPEPEPKPEPFTHKWFAEGRWSIPDTYLLGSGAEQQDPAG